MTKLKNSSFVRVFHSFGSKKIWAIAILAMADVLSMILPFYLKNVFSNIHTEFGISEGKFTSAIAIYGYVLLPSYLFGGYLADKVSLKLLIVSGLAMIGGVGFWYGAIPFMQGTEEAIFSQLVAIFVIWGLATGFIFWSALWKLLSQQATDKQQGTVNGLLGSINGLFGALIVVFSYAIYFFLKATSLDNWAFPALCWVLSATALIVCVLTMLFVEEKKKTKAFAFKWDELRLIIGNIKVWLVTLLILGVYMFQSGLSVFINYLENSLKVASVVTFILGIVRTYLSRFAVSSFAGNIADRWGKYILFITLGLVINSCLILIAIITPGFGTTINNFGAVGKIAIQIIVSAMFILLGITCWCLVTNRWAVINELNIPEKNYGLMVAFISLISFSPDAWFWHIASVVYKSYEIVEIVNGKEEKFSSQTGYQIVLTMILVVSLLAVLAGSILFFLKRKDNKRLKISVS
ncbi:MFS transporter [Spiroplasma endosymbiont of Eupeodes luniger]|uniref:MFS transporter n=1 Tax=Spiroplasma endosymbiont of Eupeodes luniger TaxID=3066300 RepID=UPI0030D006E2